MISTGFSKTTLQGPVNGEHRRGRQKNSLFDSIKEWVTVSLAGSTGATRVRVRRSNIGKQTSESGVTPNYSDHQGMAECELSTLLKSCSRILESNDMNPTF